MPKGLRLFQQRPVSVSVSASRCLGDKPSSFPKFHRTTRTTTRQRQNDSIPARKLQFGQPLYETHPHILEPGQLTPGITALEYAQRRSKLASKLPKNAVAVVAAADLKYRSTDAFYEYHQDANFFYLTGFNEPKALAVIGNDGSDNHVFHLYTREKDARSELWDGARSGCQAALDVFNADESGDIDRLDQALPSIISQASEVYSDTATIDFSRRVISRVLAKSPADGDIIHKINATKKVRPLKPIMNELRLHKSEAEIANMRKAGKASGRAFTAAMSRKFSLERDLGSYLEHKFRSNGCEASAFVPVIAGGRNALSIHYVRNNDVIRDGELVLVDGGGEYGNYISDITRTWPMNGRFTDPQRDLYTAVLNVERTCVSLCRESANISLDDIHEVAENTLEEQLHLLGFDTSPAGAIQTLFPHHVGHFIGLEVHDSPGYPRHHKLQKGQCVTVEPGIYIPDDDRWPAQFRGMGIRIEDSVCVGDDNPLNLTAEAVKEIPDIEALR